MPIIVRVKSTDQHAILLGVGYGAFSSAHPSPILGNLSAIEKSGSHHMAAITNQTGQIQWCSTSELEVVSVDGVDLSEALHAYPNSSGVFNFTGVPMSSEEVKAHYRYEEFIREDPDRLSIYSDDLAGIYLEWLENVN